MTSEEKYMKVLANFLLELTSLNIMDEEYIKKVLDIVTKYFEADYCIWHRTKNNTDYLDLREIGFSNNLERTKVVLLNSNYGNETFMIVNPKVDFELEEFLVEKLKSVLGNVSSCEFSVSDLKSEMMTDALTGVSNVDSLQKLLTSKTKFNNVGVCFVDVNGLGVINNLYGHEEGDKMLMTVVHIITKYVRKTDVYRKGGDEFVIVCENILEKEFLAKIEAIKSELPNTGYSASFGSIYRKETDSLNELISLADAFMYVEKENYRQAHPDKYSIKR